MYVATVTRAIRRGFALYEYILVLACDQKGGAEIAGVDVEGR